jgi:predicted secreted protein
MKGLLLNSSCKNKVSSKSCCYYKNYSENKDKLIEEFQINKPKILKGVIKQNDFHLLDIEEIKSYSE